MKWAVIDSKTGARLGVIEKWHKNIGTTKRPHWRVWYCLEGNESVNADTRSCLAVFLGLKDQSQFRCISRVAGDAK